MRTSVCLTVLLTIVILVGCGERNTPLQPETYYRLISQVQTPGLSQDVCVINDTAYVADNAGGITVIDILDASDPVYVESWSSTQLVKRIKAAPQNRLVIAYETGGADGVKLYSIDSKQIVAESFDAGLRGLDVMEYVDSLWILETDITEGLRGDFYINTGSYWSRTTGLPWTQAPLGEYRGMAVAQDTIAFTCLDERGVMAWSLDLVQTTNPPDSIGWVETPGVAYDVAYQDGYLYIADYFAGLAVVDASDLTSLSLVAQVVPQGANRCVRVAVDGTTAAVLDSYDGIYVFNISIPEAPIVIERIDLPEPEGLAFSGGRLLAVDAAEGLMIFQP